MQFLIYTVWSNKHATSMTTSEGRPSWNYAWLENFLSLFLSNPV